jgi:hypothetical protein
MASDIIMSSTIVDDIEFYVSTDSKTSGVSISGLARLCGVARQTMSRLCNNLQEGSEYTVQPGGVPKQLQPLYGSVFVPQPNEADQAKVVDKYTAAKIVEYYAHHQNNVDATIARISLSKFAVIGIDTWIKQITGFSEGNQLTELTTAVTNLIQVVGKLQATVSKYENIKKTTISLFPGVDYINSEIEDGSYILESDGEDGYYTLQEFLEAKGISMNKSTKLSFARKVSETFKSIKQDEPKKVLRKDKKGNLTQRLNAYTIAEFPILDVALRATLDIL